MPAEENKEKALHGDKFNDAVLKVLQDMKTKGIIDIIEMKKKFPFIAGNNPQFHAPFMVEKNDKKILIFKTNSMRSDRNKENQWDAFGIKNYFSGNIAAVVVLPGDLSKREEECYLREQRKIRKKGYFSQIDEICCLGELESIIMQYLNKDY